MRSLVVFPLVMVSFIGALMFGAVIIGILGANPRGTSYLCTIGLVVFLAQWIIRRIDPSEAWFHDRG